MIFNSRKRIQHPQSAVVIRKPSQDGLPKKEDHDDRPGLLLGMQSVRTSLISKAFLLGAAILLVSPPESRALPTLLASSQNDIHTIVSVPTTTAVTTTTTTISVVENMGIAGSYGTPIGSSPYFSSASAARLLVTPPTPIINSRENREAMKQIAKQQALQDSRLVQCYEAQLDWEQCFYYGTITSKDGTTTSVAPLTLPDFGSYPSSSSSSMETNRNQGFVPFGTKANVPTW